MDVNHTLIQSIQAYYQAKGLEEFYTAFLEVTEDDKGQKEETLKTINSYKRHTERLYEYIIINFKAELESVNKTLKQHLNGE